MVKWLSIIIIIVYCCYQYCQWYCLIFSFTSKAVTFPLRIFLPFFFVGVCFLSPPHSYFGVHVTLLSFTMSHSCHSVLTQFIWFSFPRSPPPTASSFPPISHTPHPQSQRSPIGQVTRVHTVAGTHQNTGVGQLTCACHHRPAPSALPCRWPLDVSSITIYNVRRRAHTCGAARWEPESRAALHLFFPAVSRCSGRRPGSSPDGDCSVTASMFWAQTCC